METALVILGGCLLAAALGAALWRLDVAITEWASHWRDGEHKEN